VLSAAVESLVRNDFELEGRPAAPVKGVEELITYYRLLGERLTPTPPTHGPLVGRECERDCIQKKWEKARAGR
jgi:hypothetical protein